jgi:predicted nucleic acid-binding protein
MTSLHPRCNPSAANGGLGIAQAESWWTQVDGSSRVRHEAIDALRAEKAGGVFFRHRDKEYSFTDCTSFVVMKELRLTKALTTDRHFRQMGFHAMP